MPTRSLRTDTTTRFASFLTNLFRPARRPVRARLGVTRLEDRTTPATLHWTGAASNLWGNAANWVENLNPANGDHLVFDTTTPGFTSFAPNNDIPGLTGISIGINDSSSGGDFVFGGSAVGLVTTAGVGITSTVTDGAAATINHNLVLGANTTVAVGHGTLRVNGGFSGAFTLTAASAPSATLRLDGVNAHGNTVLSSGTVAVNANGALGAGQINFAGGTLAPVSGSNLQIPNSFVVSAPSTIAGGGFFQLNGGGVLNSTLANVNTGFVTLAGALSGPGGLAMLAFTGNYVLTGAAPNTFTGGTTIGSGGVTLQKSSGVRALASPVTITTGSLTLAANDQLQGTPVFVGRTGISGRFSTAGFSDSVSSLTGTGTLDTGSVAAAGLTITGGPQLFTGTVSGSGFVTYAGSGSLTLSGANPTYTGTLTAASGRLVVAGDFSGATANVAGGTLAGTGAVRSVGGTGGFVDAAAAASTGGTLNTAAAAAASSLAGLTARFELAAAGASDQIAVGTGATLNLAGGTVVFASLGGNLGTSYTLVTSPSGGISGTFPGLPNGATLSIGADSFQINYTATAVTLTRTVGTGPRVLHWVGAAGGNWSAASNWLENAAPASGDTLVFDTTAPGFAATAAAFAPNNDVAGLAGLTVVINDASAAGDFVIGGTAFGLSAAGGAKVTSTVFAGTDARVNNPLTLAANTSIAVGLGTLTLGGAVSGAFALTANGSPGGTLSLLVDNAHTGGTVVASGSVSVGASLSLGTGLLTLAGGTLIHSTATLPNSFVVTAPSTYAGGGIVTMNGDGVLNATLRITHGGVASLNGALSGPGGLLIDAQPGQPTLGGNSANTFTGGVTILGGVLRLNKNSGNAVASPIVMGGSSFPTLTLVQTDQIADTVPVTMDINSRFNLSFPGEFIGSLNGAGTLDTGSNTATALVLTGSGASLFTGTVSGAGQVVNRGTGTTTLGGASPGFTGSVVADGGQLVVAADFSGASAFTSGTGTLGGTGVVRRIAGGSGTVNPGGVGTPGILTVAPVAANSSVNLQTFRFDLNAGGLSDTIVVGNAALFSVSSGTLAVNVLNSTFGTVYTIIASPSAGISGTFAGLPDDATFVAGGRLFRIDYTASAVTLTDRQSVVLSPAGLPTGEVGINYSQTITPSGGTGVTTLAVTGVTNPTGLTITGSGTGAVTVSGTPTTAGTVTFTVTPTDANGPQAPTVYSFTVAPGVVLNPAALPAGEQGVAYNRTITATGGQGAITLNVSGVTTVAGLTVTGGGTGTITVAGTPTATGTVTFTVTPTDAIGTGAGTVYSFNVAAPVVLTPANVPDGEVGLAYNRTITSTGGAPPVTLAVSGVTNTTGLTITGSGTGTITLSGTPTTAGQVTFTVTPTSAVGTGTGQVYTFTINPAVVLSPATLPDGEVGFAFNQSITASGGAGAISLALSGVTNTTGLTITGSGTGAVTVSGTPTAAGTVTFTVTPTDQIGTGAGTVYSFDVAPAVTLSPTSPLGFAQVGFAYSQTITPTGGTGAVTLAVSNVTNPSGLTIAGDGTGTVTVSGTPTSSGIVTFTVTPTDSFGAGTPVVYSFIVYPAVTLDPAAAADAEVGVPYTQTITPTGGAGVANLVVSNVVNAPWLTVTQTGTGAIVLSGTPTTAGDVSFTVTPTTPNGTGTPTTYTFHVYEQVFTIPPELPDGRVGTPYTATIFHHSGGALGVTLAVSNVTNPTGLTITRNTNNTITVSGIPRNPGTVTFTVTATDSIGTGPGYVYSFDVAAGVPRLTAVGADDGGPSAVRTYNPDATLDRVFDPFPGTTGGVRVAVGDFNGDGTADTAVGTGPGAFALVKVFDGKTGQMIFINEPFGDFKGGVFLAAGDITGDGTADLVITPDLSGGPRVTIISGGTFTQVANFFGIDDDNFRGGARAGVGDVNGDGFADLVVSAGFGGGPRIAGFDGKALSQGNINQKLFGDFFIFEEALRNGAYVTVGDVDGDGFADIIGGGGPGGGPRVLVLSGAEKLANRETPLANFFAGNVDNRGGVRVAVKDLDGDQFADVVVGDGTGAGSRVTGYLGKNLNPVGAPAFGFDAFPGFTGGVYVG